MTKFVIKNPVPTPEEMGRMLGMEPERVAELRRIMSAPSTRKAGSRSRVKYRSATARKRSAAQSGSLASGRGR